MPDLVVSTLLSARISADIAVAAARELFRAGYGAPRRMLEASWQDRGGPLGRSHYRRYDERTATGFPGIGPATTGRTMHQIETQASWPHP